MPDSPDHLFSDLRMNMHSTEKARAPVDAGPIAEIAGTDEAFSLWKGKISSENISEAQMKRLVKKVGRYYVPVDKKAPTQCIDGRPGTEKDRLQGAKIPGGTAGVAFASALLEAKSLSEKRTFVKDFTRLLLSYKKAGYPIGGHDDDHAHAGIGCGAIDRMRDVLDTMQEPAFKTAIDGYLSSILEEDEYIPEFIGAILKNAKRLQARKDTYFGNGYEEETKHALQKVAGDNAVETLTGGHQEALLVINKVQGTTLNRDAFSSSNEGEVQAFDYDLWAVREEAARKYPVHKKTKHGLFPGGVDTETRNKRLMFVIASIMIAVATMMQLSDGSTRVVIREPRR